MRFRIIRLLRKRETIAEGRGIRELSRVNKVYGDGRWRKLKGIALIELSNGTTRRAELHWYEAHGLGRKEIKRKRYVD
jgi:hypothetical protein